MLTKKQVRKLFDNDLEIRFSRKKVHKLLKGEYDPSLSEVYIYRQNIESVYDRDITLLHEFIHARDDEKSARIESTDDQVEREAKITYRKNHPVIRYIKSLYNLPDKI